MTTYLNQTTDGSITRSQTGEIDVKLSLYRDGRRVEDSSGNYPEVIVKWNAPYENSNVATGGHAYMTATGL